MKYRYVNIFIVIVLFIGLLAPNQMHKVSAQIEEPQHVEVPFLEPCLPDQPCQDEEGNWYLRSDNISDSKSLNEAKSIGGPDDFGYTWDDSVAFSWIDATIGGTEAAISDRRDQVGPISLPFNFKFYENTYSEIYITGSGYLTFQDGYIDSYPDIPNQAEPNDIISPLSMSWDYDTGKVYYKTGVNASGQYFVVEWSELQTSRTQSSTFQVILYENGDIFFQFKEVNLVFDMGGYVAISGIEDSQGVDGLLYSKYGWDFISNSVIKFTRPTPGARVKITPANQGQFTKSDSINQNNLTITNIGEFGNDIMNLEVSSLWPVTLIDSATLTPLVDTDSDSIVDTGILAQGQSLDIIVQSTTPVNPLVGTTNLITVQATSDIDPNITKTAKIDLAIPAPFAQAYSGLNNGQVNLDLVFPEGRSTIDVTPEWQYGYDPIVSETPENNFITVWSESGWDGNAFTTDLFYKIVDKFGNTVRSKSLLETPPPISVEFDVENYAPMVSIAPNGNIMITWVNRTTNSDMNISCLDIWYSILNPDGTIATGPNNLTNITSCATTGLIQLRPSVTASDDNTFMITWDARVRDANNMNLFVEEVLYSIIQSDGVIVKPPTKIMVGVADSLEFFNSYVSIVNGDQFFLTYNKYQKINNNWYYGFYFQVINYNGQLLKAETEIPNFFGNRIISKQLSGGNILMTSSYQFNDEYSILNRLINNTDFSTVDSFYITHPLISSYIHGLSITRDSDNHGILTWTDEDQNHLYYALIDGNGSVIINPIIFRSAGTGEEIYINYYGGSNTTNSWEPEAGLDGLVNLSSTIYGVSPGGNVGIEVFYTNQGGTTATNVKLSLTIDDDLTFNYDTSGIAPTISGNTIEWELPDLELLNNNRFIVYLSIPDNAPLGTQYSASFALSTDGTDSNPSNSSIDAILFSAKQVFLPLLAK